MDDDDCSWACAVCGIACKDGESTEQHIASAHLFLRPFGCPRCPSGAVKFPTASAVSLHLQLAHRVAATGLVHYELVPDSTRKREELRRLLVKSCRKAKNGKPTNENGFEMPRTQLPQAPISAVERREVRIEATPLPMASSPPKPVFSTIPAVAPTTSTAESKTAGGEAIVVECKNDDLEKFLASMNAGLPNNNRDEDDSENGELKLGRELDLSALMGENAAKMFASAVNSTPQTEVSELDSSGVDLAPFGDLISYNKAHRRTTGEVLTCAGCGQSVSNYLTSLLLHASVHHLKAVMFRCTVCGKTWNSILNRCKAHVQKHHSDMSVVEDYRKLHSADLRRLVKSLFPKTS